MTTSLLKSINRLGRWHLHFSDTGDPVGYRNEMSEPFPASFNPHGWETYEDAQDAMLELESYLMRNIPSNLTKKKKK